MVVDGGKVLCEAKSPSVIKKVGKLLPPCGIELGWVRGQSLVPKILAKSALCLGLRKMEWLFLTCHNYWIVCRLVRDDDHPFLAYSSKISIKDSSEPFRTFIGAILSVIKGAPVKPSTFSPYLQLDTIEDDIDDGSGAYPGSSREGSATNPPMASYCYRAGRENAESELMITSSSPNSPESFQVWVHLHASSNNTLFLPESDKKGKQRLWLARFVGSGSTGNVWQCHVDNSDDSFALKIVELLCPLDTDRRQRLRNEFNVYLILEGAYQSGQLHDRITPRCYGAFEGNGVDVLILDLCDRILNAWDELSTSERAQVYKLAQDLHSIGIVHGDLEPRNIMRLLEVGQLHTPHPTAVQNEKCSELQALQSSLWKRHPG